eukprot:COSAG02_NODE_62956_length_264_cov_0.939394_1_plen_43_part_10
MQQLWLVGPSALLWTATANARHRRHSEPSTQPLSQKQPRDSLL